MKQPTDPDSRNSLVRSKPITRSTRIQREYRFEWQPRSTFGGLIALLLALLVLAGAFMFSLMLMVGIALLLAMLAGLAFWKHYTGAQRRK